MTEPVFRLRLRVRYPECDAQQVVFNARYADYVDLAMTEFMQAIGWGYRDLLAAGLDNQVVRLLLEWQAPARFDEVVELTVATQRIGRTSFTMAIEMQADGRPLCRAEATYVLMTTEPLAKTAIPSDLKAALEHGAPGVVIDQTGR